MWGRTRTTVWNEARYENCRNRDHEKRHRQQQLRQSSVVLQEKLLIAITKNHKQHQTFRDSRPCSSQLLLIIIINVISRTFLRHSSQNGLSQSAIPATLHLYAVHMELIRRRKVSAEVIYWQAERRKFRNSKSRHTAQLCKAFAHGISNYGGPMISLFFCQVNLLPS